MSRTMAWCDLHGEYMEFGPDYGCYQCERLAQTVEAALAGPLVSLEDAFLLADDDGNTH